MKKYFLNIVIIAIVLFFSIQPSFAIRIGLNLDVKQTHFGTSDVGSIYDANNDKIKSFIGDILKRSLEATSSTINDIMKALEKF